MRMASLWPLDLEVVASLLHLWLSLITFMVGITFMGDTATRQTTNYKYRNLSMAIAHYPQTCSIFKTKTSLKAENTS